jgi:hypothetical protein
VRETPEGAAGKDRAGPESWVVRACIGSLHEHARQTLGTSIERWAETVRPRTLLLFAVVVLLGAVATVSPALAGASEVKLEVAPNCNTSGWACWNPIGNPEGNVGFYEVAPFTIAQGGTISFEDNDSNALTDVVWKGAAPSSCTPAVPSTPETGWKSTCTFANAGEYEFESKGLFDDGTSNYTKYKVVVTGPPTPTATTEQATAVTETEATLNGRVDPEGQATSYYFEYGSTESYGTKTSEMLAGSGSTNQEFHFTWTGLSPNTTYDFQLVAVYGAGKTKVEGGNITFKTAAPPSAPTASTQSATGASETEATLKGTVDPDGEATEYFFEYGTETSYGQKTGKVTLPAGENNQAVSATVKGLTPGTEYHFRLVAENHQGSEKGMDGSFKTASPAAKEPTPPTKEPSPTPTPTPTPTPGPISPEPEIVPPVGGSPVATLALASAQHGDAVHGTIQVPAADGGARLEVQLLAQGASLAKVKRSSSSRVGRFVRSSAPAGTVSFTVALDAQAKRALRKHHKLALTVKIVLTPKHGAAMTLTRSVVVR